MINLIIDCHTHSRNSSDADNDTVRERCIKAMEIGLDAMAITDHCEINRFYEKSHYNITKPLIYDEFGFEKGFRASISETCEAKDEFKGKFNLICGVELGQATYDTTLADKILLDERIDFVIGSVHELPNHEDFAFLDYSKEDIPKLMEENFQEVLKLCKWNGFDVLGHLTYALRYIEGEYGCEVDLKPYKDIIAEIFKTIIKNGKGIEINSSGLRQKYKKAFPDLEFVKLYKDLGGEILSVGSDCHKTSDLAAGIPKAIEIAKAAGFEKIAYFKKRKPYFINI